MWYSFVVEYIHFSFYWQKKKLPTNAADASLMMWSAYASSLVATQIESIHSHFYQSEIGLYVSPGLEYLTNVNRLFLRQDINCWSHNIEFSVQNELKEDVSIFQSILFVFNSSHCFCLFSGVFRRWRWKMRRLFHIWLWFTRNDALRSTWKRSIAFQTNHFMWWFLVYGSENSFWSSDSTRGTREKHFCSEIHCKKPEWRKSFTHRAKTF